MKYASKFFFIILILLSSKIFSQAKSDSNHLKKQYNYTFKGQLNSQSILDLENRLSSLVFVTMAKIKYKADSQKGELFLHTSEKAISSEEDKGFDLIELKKLLISNNLEPIELTVTSLK
ncbi:MAG: hypothetical protein Q7W45_05560 [Bacteroidota bacterium]|nr:hypothetical protein [Bacteroidota bacterium]MDP3144914.1 hypothetical protein [Bacteroidota bacterium]MDP3557073.1 hypothetical protein [Bacteroidota bacterium]